MSKSKVVFGIFKTKSQAERAVDSLHRERFRPSDISLLLSEENGERHFAHLKSTKAPEGATAGASTGAVIGGALGMLAGIGALAIPGIGPFIAAGPIMGALAGAGLGGAVGGISGALIGFGMPEYEAKRFEGYVREGGILISVHADDSEWATKAKQVLTDAGASDVSVTGEVRNDWQPLSTSEDKWKKDIDPRNSGII